jgi:hypothetical protein
MHSTLRPLVALVFVVALAAAQNGHMTITMYSKSSRCTGPATVVTRALPLCMPESGAYFATCKKKSTVRIHRRLLALIILFFVSSFEQCSPAYCFHSAFDSILSQMFSVTSYSSHSDCCTLAEFVQKYFDLLDAHSLIAASRAYPNLLFSCLAAGTVRSSAFMDLKSCKDNFDGTSFKLYCGTTSNAPPLRAQLESMTPILLLSAVSAIFMLT